MFQFGTSAFNMVVYLRKLDEVDNECTSYKFSLCAICVPKIIRVGGNLAKLCKIKYNFAWFLRHGVDVVRTHCVVQTNKVTGSVRK